MRLVADIVNGHAQVDALFDYRGILAPFPLTMVLDTGASCSCLLPDHVYYFRIPYTQLEDSPHEASTAGGRVRTKILPDVDLYLPVYGGPLNTRKQVWPIHFNEFEVIPPLRRHMPEPRHRVVSLIGMDVLSSFNVWRWDWDRKKVYLDTP